MEKKELLKEILNAVFPSDESDGIEHVDMSYKEFVKKLVQLSK